MKWSHEEEGDDEEDELNISPAVLGACIFGILTLLVLVTG
jgi:hypothetical protein